jgi:hypothetical protein
MVAVIQHCTICACTFGFKCGTRLNRDMMVKVATRAFLIRCRMCDPDPLSPLSYPKYVLDSVGATLLPLTLIGSPLWPLKMVYDVFSVLILSWCIVAQLSVIRIRGPSPLLVGAISIRSSA